MLIFDLLTCFLSVYLMSFSKALAHFWLTETCGLVLNLPISETFSRPVHFGLKYMLTIIAQVQRLSVGKIPRSMVVVLEDDLVDSCKSGEKWKTVLFQIYDALLFELWAFGLFLGDDVTIYGVMCQRWKPCYDGAPCYVELALRANNVEVSNRSNHQSSCVAMKDIQKDYEDFWKSYKHFPLAGRYVCACRSIYMYIHIDMSTCLCHSFFICICFVS